MVDCENHWVALPPTPGEGSYGYGYVYLDPEAGFTLRWGGRFTLEAHEHYRKVSERFAGQERLIIRLGGQGVAAPLPNVAPLSDAARTQLGLPEKPGWMIFYEDTSDAVTRQVNRGRAYNAIGDPERALTYLEPAYQKKAQAKGLAFELTYAYNALQRFDQAITVLTSAVQRDPRDAYVCSELGFSYLHARKSQEAIAQYLHCLAISHDANVVRKSEMAFNLAQAYAHVGDKEQCQQWRAKAQEWAPQGSPLSGYFTQHPDSMQACAL
jgi:tetratricopeptide (TPR) repeat protein